MLLFKWIFYAVNQCLPPLTLHSTSSTIANLEILWEFFEMRHFGKFKVISIELNGREIFFRNQCESFTSIILLFPLISLFDAFLIDRSICLAFRKRFILEIFWMINNIQLWFIWLLCLLFFWVRDPTKWFVLFEAFINNNLFVYGLVFLWRCFYFTCQFLADLSH